MAGHKSRESPGAIGGANPGLVPLKSPAYFAPQPAVIQNSLTGLSPLSLLLWQGFTLAGLLPFRGKHRQNPDRPRLFVTIFNQRQGGLKAGTTTRLPPHFVRWATAKIANAISLVTN